MKKWLLPAVAVAGLTACGGLAFVLGLDSKLQVRTEYRLGSVNGPFVGCDNVDDTINTTQVRVIFTTNAKLSSAQVGLIGQNSTTVDPNFKATVPADVLNGPSNTYSILFTANSAGGAALPAGVSKQAIVVKPTQAKVKVVTASSAVGGFKPWVRATSGQYTAEFTTEGAVEVYNNCKIVSTTNEDV